MPNLSEHQQQRELLDQLRASNDPQAQQQATQLQQLYHDREMAGLADDVYDAAKAQGQPDAGWIRASEHLDKLREYAPQLNMTDEQLKDLLKPDKSGFRAEIYLPDPAVLGPGYKPTVVFKGSSGEVLTPDGFRETTGEDFLANNFPQSVGLRTDYYDRAMELASALKAQRMDFELAGHSLGGGMASAAAAVTGMHTTTLNAAGLHPATAQRFAQENGLPVYDTQKTVVAYQVAGEVLNDGIQQNIHRLDAFRREELGGVLKETSTLLKDLPQGKALLASQLDAAVPRYAQPSVHAFLDRLEQGDTAQLLRELPLAAGQAQPLLAAKRREHPDDPSSGPVDRARHLSLREVSNFSGPMLDIVYATAQGARLGRGVGGAMAQAGQRAGQGMEAAGDMVNRTTQAAAQLGQHATHALGDAAAHGVERAGTFGAQGVQALGEVQAGAERLQGRIEGGAAVLGAAALWQASAVLPQGLREQVHAQAGRLAQAGVGAQQRGQTEAAHAVHAAAEQAQGIRQGARVAGGTLGAVADRAGRVQHDAVAAAGSAADATLDAAGRYTQAASAQLPGVYAAQSAAATAAVGAATVLNPTTLQGGSNLARTGVFASQAAPSAKEATDRHLMTETVLPSLDARIHDIEHKARQQVAPEQGGPQAPATGVSARQAPAVASPAPHAPAPGWGVPQHASAQPPQAATAAAHEQAGPQQDMQQQALEQQRQWQVQEQQRQLQQQRQQEDERRSEQEESRQAPRNTQQSTTAIDTAYARGGQMPTATADAPGMDDPRHARNPYHGLYSTLHERIPDASEKRLLQFTAACRENGITAEQLSTIHFDEQNGKIYFMGSGFLSSTARIDLDAPSPAPEHSIRQIQQCDQQQAQRMSEMHAQNAQQGQMQSAPMMM
ncbi:phospholipase [Xanthomonas translucens]|uniref:phospholipase n=1 Tax=Xanthomonas campestris pv. translucens TaxID=343 RepID=UPI001F6018B0|nr:phospholipase [Xanthomonas translucens]UNT98983.1 phospholipase [Xanthomonas translucens pv. translucens]